MIAAAWAEQKAIKEVMIFLQRRGQRPPPHRTRPPPKPAPARPLKRCNTESTRRCITSCHRYHATSTWFILSATCDRATVQYPILPKAGGACQYHYALTCMLLTARRSPIRPGSSYRGAPNADYAPEIVGW